MQPTSGMRNKLALGLALAVAMMLLPRRGSAFCPSCWSLNGHSASSSSRGSGFSFSFGKKELFYLVYGLSAGASAIGGTFSAIGSTSQLARRNDDRSNSGWYVAALVFGVLNTAAAATMFGTSFKDDRHLRVGLSIGHLTIAVVDFVLAGLGLNRRERTQLPRLSLAPGTRGGLRFGASWRF